MSDERLAQAAATFFVVIPIAFTLYRMLPGGSVSQRVFQRFRQCAAQSRSAGCDIEQSQRNAEAIVDIDPDKPVPLVYADYLKDVFLGRDFGRSIQHGRSVFNVLFNAMPWSLVISLHGLVPGGRSTSPTT